MSGLVCVFARDRAPVDPADVEAVLERQSHRGPDGLRVWYDGTVGLGHAALDPTGKGTMAEPLVEDGGRLAVVGDFRIDNHRELISLLEMSSEQVSDAGIVLAAYRRWGIDTPCHLEGPFAFVIWDARQQRIFCARDHLGVKPLTYHLARELFVCASEAEAVPCHRRVSRRINEARIADFLVSELEGVDHTSTFFEGVFRLPPAHVLVVEPGGHRLHRYWEPDVGTELRLGTDEEYAEVFTDVFRQAVESCLHGIDSPGIMLSGGIDSGTVAVHAGSLSGEGKTAPVKTFSAIDEVGDPSVESSCIRAMIEYLGMESFTITPDDVSEMSLHDRRALLDCGEPFDSSMVVARLLSTAAAGAGCRTILDGVDGDVVVSTSVPITSLLRQGRFFHAWRELAAHQRLHPGVPCPGWVMTTGVVKAWLPAGLRRFGSELRNRRGRVEDVLRESLIDRSFARRIHLEERLDQLRHRVQPGSDDDSRRGHAQDVTHPYVAVALERYDRVAARCGIDVRHPFFDLRLVKLCLALPWNLKVRDGRSKLVLRLATENEIPAAIRHRHDAANVMWRMTSRVIAKERNALLSTVEGGEGMLGPFVDCTKLDRVRDVPSGNFTDQGEVWIWQAATLARWLAAADRRTNEPTSFETEGPGGIRVRRIHAPQVPRNRR